MSSMHTHVSGAKNKSIRFFLKSDQMILVFEDTQKSIEDFNGNVFCPGTYCCRQKCVYVYTWKAIDEIC